MFIPLVDVETSPKRYLNSLISKSHVPSNDVGKVSDYLLNIPEVQQGSIENKSISKAFLTAFLNYLQLPVSKEKLDMAIKKASKYDVPDDVAKEDNWVISIPTPSEESKNIWSISEISKENDFNALIWRLWEEVPIPFSEEGLPVSKGINDYNEFFTEAIVMIDKYLFNRELTYLMNRQNVREMHVSEIIQWGSYGKGVTSFPDDETENQSIFRTIEPNIQNAFMINSLEVCIPFTTCTQKHKEKNLAFIYDMQRFIRYYQRNANMSTCIGEDTFVVTDRHRDPEFSYSIPINKTDIYNSSPTKLEEVFWKSVILTLVHAIVHAFEILSAYGLRHTILQTHSESFIERYNQALPLKFHYR